MSPSTPLPWAGVLDVELSGIEQALKKYMFNARMKERMNDRSPRNLEVYGKNREEVNYENFNILFNVSKCLYSNSRRTICILPSGMAPDCKILWLRRS